MGLTETGTLMVGHFGEPSFSMYPFPGFKFEIHPIQDSSSMLLPPHVSEGENNLVGELVVVDCPSISTPFLDSNGHFHTGGIFCTCK